MKKFYSFLLLMVVAALSFSASAKSYTIHCDHPEWITLINIDGDPFEFVNNEVQLSDELGNIRMFYPVSVKERGYEITGIEGTNRTYSLPASDVQIYDDEIDDGATVTITVTKPQSKTITFKVDNSEYVSIYNPNTYSNVVFTNNEASVSFTGTVSFSISANSTRQICEIKNLTTNENISGISLPATNINFNASLVSDGDVVMITTEEKTLPKFIVTADRPEILNVMFNYTPYQANADGEFIIPITYQWGTLEVSVNSVYSGDYAVASATLNGVSQSLNNNKLSIYAGSIAGDAYVHVTTKNLAESRTSSFLVEVEGDNYSSFTLYRSDFTPVDISQSITIVRFDPDKESNFSISSKDYNKPIWKAELDGTPLTSSYGSFYFQVEDGNRLKIYPDYPQKDVFVNIELENPEYAGIIRNVSVNYEPVADWASGFWASMGSRLSINFNTSEYTNINATLNGEGINSYGYDAIIDSDQDYNFYISCEKLRPYNVVFSTDDPEGVEVYIGYSKDPDARVTLTGEETVIEVPRNNSALYICAADGYYISELTDIYGYSLYVNSSNYVSGDMEIFCFVEKYNRSSEMTMYVAPGYWPYFTLTMGKNSASPTRINGTSGLIGYTTVNFDPNCEVPMNIDNYPVVYAYLNGERLGSEYSTSYIDFTPTDGDIVKFYTEEPSSYDVTYNIAEDAEIEVRHDIVTLIDSPASHSVLAGTRIIISEKVAESPVARVAEADGHIEVSVNDTPVEADNEGRFVIDVNDHSNISVTKAGTSGISSITAAEAAGDAPVYNLQGIRVAKASDIRQLPAGIYIVNGAKVRR